MPSMGEAMQPNDYSYSAFSRHPFVRDLNARLVDMADIAPGQRVVDLACGTGIVTRLILEHLRDAKNSAIIAIDQSATALKQAMEDLKDVKDSAVQFVQSRVEPLSETVKCKVDTIVFCNAIHYVSDKDQLIKEVFKVLKPGGQFAFNTSFFDGGQPPESHAFYRKWMLRASRILRRDYGLSPRGAAKTQARKHLTADGYRDLVESHGLKVLKQEIDLVRVPLEGWLDISTFEDWITGIMPGVPLDKASAALKEGCAQTFREMGIDHVPRNWLDIVAVRV